MPKLSKKEILKKINEKITDTDLATELMEDVEDSFEGVDTSDLEKQIEELQAQNEELKTKYKERFLKGEDTNIDPNKKKPANEVDEEDDEPEQPKKFEDLFDEKGELK